MEQRQYFVKTRQEGDQVTAVAVEPHTDQYLNIVKNIAFVLLADTLIEAND